MGKFGQNIPKDRKIYGNYQVLSPDGYLMFRCDEKKANWYLSRNLATIIKQNPFTIQLKFKPKGLGNHNKPFGLSEMKNQCVNCGTEDFLTRHHIVPFCYRKHFPISFKSHNFHDVLSMCLECHEKYERKADELKKKLSLQYNSPINGDTSELKKDHLKAIKSANTLLKSYDCIPKFRVEELKNEVRNYLLRDFNIEDLITLSNYKQNLLKKTHGQIVIEKVDNLQEFIELWRNHFIENNQCLFLPKSWSVKNVIIINDTE